MGHLLISGGTRGIGASVVEKFIDKGFLVTALYSSNDIAANELRSRLNVAEDRLSFTRKASSATLTTRVQNTSILLPSSSSSASAQRLARRAAIWNTLQSLLPSTEWC